MEDSIKKVCMAEGIDEGKFMRKHCPIPMRSARIMLWLYLIREKKLTYSAIAARFSCSRRNVIWSVRGFEGNMEFNRSIRESYEKFKKKAGLLSSQTPLSI